MLKLCQELDYQPLEFHIYGSGSEQKAIAHFISSHPALPIYYHGEVSRNELHHALLEYDLGIIPLLNRIYGSVPSKIFEYAKLGLPIMYFGGGEGESIVTDHKLGWVAKAGDYKELNKTLSSLKKPTLNEDFKEQIKTSAVLHFDLKKQLDKLVQLLQ